MVKQKDSSNCQRTSASDSLSPYLFWICTEWLVSLLTKAKAEKKITSVRISRGAPIINHLFFTDDSILFCEYGREQKHLSVVGDLWESIGIAINQAKTAFTFSKNVRVDTWKNIMEFRGLAEATEHLRYTGLPPLVGQRKMQAFSELEGKIWRKLQG